MICSLHIDDAVFTGFELLVILLVSAGVFVLFLFSLGGGQDSANVWTFLGGLVAESM